MLLDIQHQLHAFEHKGYAFQKKMGKDIYNFDGF